MEEPQAYQRHDITDRAWELLEPHLPGRKGVWGGKAQDNRKFINAVFWVIRTGAPWRDLPPGYGGWSNTHRRFIRWRDKGIWEKILEELIEAPDYEWLMIDASHLKVHPRAAGARGGNQVMRRTKGGSTPNYTWPWMRMVCRSESLLRKVAQRIALTFQGDITAEHLLADKGYDTDAIVAQAQEKGMQAVIPPQEEQKDPATL